MENKSFIIPFHNKSEKILAENVFYCVWGGGRGSCVGAEERRSRVSGGERGRVCGGERGSLLLTVGVTFVYQKLQWVEWYLFLESWNLFSCMFVSD